MGYLYMAFRRKKYYILRRCDTRGREREIDVSATTTNVYLLGRSTTGLTGAPLDGLSALLILSTGEMFINVLLILSSNNKHREKLINNCVIGLAATFLLRQSERGNR